MESHKWGRLRENVIVEITTHDPETIGLPVEIFVPLPAEAQRGDAMFENTLYPCPAYATRFDESLPAWVVDETGKRTAEIFAQLTQIDQNSFRPLRAIAAGNVTDDDLAIIAKLEERASDLRIELNSLSQTGE